MSMLAERECWARRPDRGAKVEVQVTRLARPRGRACGWATRSEVEGARGGDTG